MGAESLLDLSMAPWKTADQDSGPQQSRLARPVSLCNSKGGVRFENRLFSCSLSKTFSRERELSPPLYGSIFIQQLRMAFRRPRRILETRGIKKYPRWEKGPPVPRRRNFPVFSLSILVLKCDRCSCSSSSSCLLPLPNPEPHSRSPCWFCSEYVGIGQRFEWSPREHCRVRLRRRGASQINGGNGGPDHQGAPPR